MEDNLKEAWDLLTDPDRHIYLTGSAGTGKTTLIRKFIAANEGYVIVLAPTGIAAVNVGGMTIHKFFHFPARPLSYDTVKRLNPEIPEDAAKIAIIKACRYIIIDEISMVRADIMDQIAWFMHKNFPGKPFGGKKIIMVGDLDQLPPVVATDQEKVMLTYRYKSEFFFDAKVWVEFAKFHTVKLTKIFRQSDPEFVTLLNNIKTGQVAPYEIDNLNKRCINQGYLSPTDGVMLCATNKVASEVNGIMINSLPGDIIRIEGVIEGDFDSKNCTVDPIIDLKIGCRIMTMRNDPNNEYQNGTVGWLRDVNIENGLLSVELETGEIFNVGKYVFESIEYKYDPDKDKISHTVTGRFRQYPVRVAYAMTVHKSQGKTFDKVIIDLGERGAFAHGQVYVALSRCRTIEGITLRRPIAMKDLIYNSHVTNFNKQK